MKARSSRQSARCGPGVIVSVVAAGILAGCASPVLSGRPVVTEPPASTGSPGTSLTATSSAPAPPSSALPPSASQAAAEWQLINTLAGYFVHDLAWSSASSRMYLAGEELPSQAGVVLISDDGGASVASVIRLQAALSLRAIAVSGSQMWVGGSGADGHGFLARSIDGGTSWTRAAVPGSVTDVSALAIRDDGSVLLAVRLTDTRGELLVGGGAASKIWTARYEAPATGAFLPALASAGSTVAAGGTTDVGSLIVILEGKQTRVQSSPAGLSAIHAVTFRAPRSLVVAGRTGPRPESGEAALAVSADNGVSWSRTRLPGASDALAVAFSDATAGVVLVATGSGNQVDLTSDGGASWHLQPLPIAPPTNLERLVAVGHVIYALGGSGLLREVLGGPVR